MVNILNQQFIPLAVVFSTTSCLTVLISSMDYTLGCMVTVKHAWKYVQRIGYNSIIAAMIIDTKINVLNGSKEKSASFCRVTAITSEKLLGFWY